MHDFHLERSTIRQLSWEYYSNQQSFPADLLGTEKNTFYQNNRTRLQQTVLSNFANNVEPFNYYNDYHRSVQEALTEHYDPLTNDVESLLHSITLPHDNLETHEVQAIHSRIITDSIQEYERLVTQSQSDQVPKYRVKNSLNDQQRNLWISDIQAQSIINRIYSDSFLLNIIDQIRTFLGSIQNWLRANRILALILLALLTVMLILGWNSYNKWRNDEGTTKEKISYGAKQLIIDQKNPEFNTEFTKCTNIFKVANQVEDFKKAQVCFEDLLKPTEKNPKAKNNPEALIYKNNAIAMQYPRQYRTVATSVPISGKESLNGAKEILRGIALVQEENNKTASNSPLLVKIADDEQDNDEATKIAKDFVKDQETLGVIGHNASGVSDAVASIYNNHLVMISPTSSADSLTNEDKNNGYIYRVVQTDSESVNRLLKYIDYKKFKKIYICAALDKDDPSKLAKNAQSFVNAFPKEKRNDPIDCFLPPKIENPKTPGEENLMESYDALLSNAKIKVEENLMESYDALLLVASTDTKDAAWAVSEPLSKPQLKDKGLLGNDSLLRDIPTKGKDSISVFSSDALNNRLTLVAPWHQDDNQQYAKQYVEKYKKLWGVITEGLNWRSAMAYDATLALKTAIDQLNLPNNQNIRENREAVAKALKKVEIPADKAATGIVRFTDKGDRDISASPNLAGYIVRARKIGNKFIYICIEGCDSSAAPKTDPQ